MLPELASTVMLGTERGELEWPQEESPLGELVSQITTTAPEPRVLMVAAAAAGYAAAGWLPANLEAPSRPPQCQPETLADCSPAAATLLVRILDLHEDLLETWLHSADRAGVHAPFALLPRLLQKGALSKALRDPISKVLGARGRWLARQNTSWTYALGLAAEQELAETAWEEGRSQERAGYLSSLRSRDPAAARELLAEVWGQETAAVRSQFLATLQVGLSMDDEPFLEQCLDDRSKQVRAKANGLLATLPGSRRAARMRERCQQLMSYRRKLLKKTLDVETPAEFGTLELRDGLSEKGRNAAKLGAGAWRLKEVVAATPCDFWSQELGLSARELLVALNRHEWRDAIVTGLFAAAQAGGDQEMAAALLELASGDGLDLHGIIAMVSQEQRDAFLISKLRKAPDDEVVTWLSLGGSQGAECWSEELSRAALARLRAMVSQELRGRARSRDLKLLRFFEQLGLHLDLGLATEALAGWPMSHQRWPYVEDKFNACHLTLSLRISISQELAP